MNKILGIDPGLNRTGWAIIEDIDFEIKFVASGVILSSPKDLLARRLAGIFISLQEIQQLYLPSTAAIEETYVNKNFSSSLLLAQAKAVALLSLELGGISYSSYQAKQIKKAVTGYGIADKKQIQSMVKLILPSSGELSEDAADATAIAICHSIFLKYDKCVIQQAANLI